MLKKKKGKKATGVKKRVEVRELAPEELAKASGGVEVSLTCRTIDNDPYAGLGFPAHLDPQQFNRCGSPLTSGPGVTWTPPPINRR